jgi:hypothetical protein
MGSMIQTLIGFPTGPYINLAGCLQRQITEGGPIIFVQTENEYPSNPIERPPFKAEMMQQLK